MIPAWHTFLIEITKDADPISKFVLLFFLDPTEYVWKWILATIAGVWALLRAA
jgi:hypothetical protein